MKPITLATAALAILTAAALPLDSALADNRADNTKAQSWKVKDDGRNTKRHYSFRHDSRRDRHDRHRHDGHYGGGHHKHGGHKDGRHHDHHYYGGWHRPWRHKHDHWVYNPYPLWSGLFIGGTLFLD